MVVGSSPTGPTIFLPINNLEALPTGFVHCVRPKNVRRSDDNLRFDCETDTDKKGFGTIKSDMEGAKLGASVLFFDLGITDAITDKHRTYANSFVIPVR